ncbi:MAG: hypothetical protein K1X79_07590 [Oligoflexia bacterium]|nr:hypothetical protein [Oligoflexia bacterium]
MKSPLTLLAFLALLLLSIAQGIRFADWNLEDGYIIYRIVRNILAGHGWAFNPGEVHNASTSVLNTVLLTLFSLISGDIPRTAHILGTLFLFLSSWMSFLVLRAAYGFMPAFAAAASATFILANNATWGLESYLFACLVTSFVYLEAQGRNAWHVLALSVLARPDSLLLVAMKTAQQIYSTRRIPFRGLGIFALIIAPWATYSLFTFSQVFPDTLSNKVWQGNSGYWGQGLIYLKSFWSHVYQTSEWRQAMFIGAAIGTLVLALQKSTLTYLALFGWMQQAAYMYLNVPAYHWYFAYFDFACLLTAFALAGIFWKLLLARFPNIRALHEPQPRLAWGLAIVAIVYSCYDLAQALAKPSNDSGNRHYEFAIRYLEDQKIPDGTLAAVEVGTLGWGTQRKILDITGLTSPNPELISGKNSDVLFRAEPLILLVHDPIWMFEKAIVSDVRFRFMYGPPRTIYAPTRHLTYFLREHSYAEATPEALQRYVTDNFPTFQEITVAEVESLPAQSSDGCVVDTVNGALATERRTKVVPPLLRIEGWALDRQRATLPEPIRVVLRAKDKAYAIIPARVKRRDVAKHFENEALEQCGYSLEGNISNLPDGTYAVMVAHGTAAEAERCDTGKLIVIKR